MAISKVCGIENEFGFSVLDQGGNQLLGDEYREILRSFVKEFLKYQKAVRHDKSKEARRTSVITLEDVAGLFKETAHDVLADNIGPELDGFLGNGARFYMDVDHPEYSTPECLNPLDLVVHDKASELVMMDALRLYLNQLASRKDRIVLHKNNSDGAGKSYGSHLNILLSRDLVSEKDNFLYLLQHYLPFQISRIILTGGGKVGSENDRPSCAFQLSQRADFFERLVAINTMESRPIFNLRDEPHATAKKYFRLHDISTDALMCEYADFLRIALTQVVLAMIEDRFLEEVLLPKKPVEAIIKISRDLRFKEMIDLEGGQRMTGLEILRKYLLAAGKYLNVHPMTDQHTQAVAKALELSEILEKDPMKTFGYLDWTTTWALTKLQPDAALGFSKLFRKVASDGLYYELVKSGKIKRLVTDEQILAAKFDAPANTRAFLRSGLLKKLGDRVVEVDWSGIKIRVNDSVDISVDLMDPVLDNSTAVVLQSILGL
ncbi:MAG: proteasome accessory factor PafA2 family protein [Candidatus Harrisonbacteria bacterium]|nr:proteasome accessory factor PafA2 family protein [Candidatus Harrisonbacteria bacterium]